MCKIIKMFKGKKKTNKMNGNSELVVGVSCSGSQLAQVNGNFKVLIETASCN